MHCTAGGALRFDPYLGLADFLFSFLFFHYVLFYLPCIIACARHSRALDTALAHPEHSIEVVLDTFCSDINIEGPSTLLLGILCRPLLAHLLVRRSVRDLAFARAVARRSAAGARLKRARRVDGAFVCHALGIAAAFFSWRHCA
jgi:hypothetical protein